MKTAKLVIIIALNLILCCGCIFEGGSKRNKLTDEDYTALKIIEGIVQLFQQKPDSIWPGYNLSKSPVMVYLPSEWTLLLNYKKEVDGFNSYPENWPDLGTDVQIFYGQYKDLAGQLVFDFQVDTIKVAAINIPFKYFDEYESNVAYAFGFIAHEAFHQFQHDNFGEIVWAREEKYPILDKENTALAYLEMQLLIDALKMMKAGNDNKCSELIKQFIAVRNFRWKRGDQFIAKYEQGLEINEGTARYVEKKSIDLIKSLKYKSSLKNHTSFLPEDLAGISFPEFILQDFHDRITGNSISPEDMLRNRVYPVGSAQGFLLDYFNIEWKSHAQKAGPEFTYAKLFKDYFGLDESEYVNLVETSKKDYEYEKILVSTDSLIQAHLDGYRKELLSFEAQTGYRFEIFLSSGNLSRSRSSSGKRWTVNKGTRQLCNHYNIYSLKNRQLLLQIYNSGVFEENDYKEKTKKLVFYTDEMSSVVLDGKPLKYSEGESVKFINIEMQGTNFKFRYDNAGSILIADSTVKISIAKHSVAGALLNIILKKDVNSAIRQYYYIKKHHQDKYDFGENELNTLGYILLETGKISEAIEIFKLNLEVYPESANVYDSLGEAYMNNGDTELAIKNYKKSLELDPGNQNAIKMLKKLKSL